MVIKEPVTDQAEGAINTLAVCRMDVIVTYEGNNLYFSSQACWSRMNRSPLSSAMMNPKLNCPTIRIKEKSFEASWKGKDELNEGVRYKTVKFPAK